MKKYFLVYFFSLFSLFSVYANETVQATFAGGCFWCMEPPFDKLEGVHKTISGFSGGDKENPSYQEVSAGKTKHIESVQITYDPQKVSYQSALRNPLWLRLSLIKPFIQQRIIIKIIIKKILFVINFIATTQDVINF